MTSHRYIAQLRYALTAALLLSLFLSHGVQTTRAQITQSDSHGRRWSQLIEPPAPDPNWNTLREQQLTTAQRLKDIGLSSELKVTGSKDAGGLVELLPEDMQISAAFLDDDRFKLELGTALPKLPGAAHAAMAKLAFEFKADTPTVSEFGYEGPISPSSKVTSTVKYDQILDPNWTLGLEIQKLFVKFKGEIADGAINPVVEISLVNLFNSARGLSTPNDLPRDLIIKVDTVKFYNAVIRAGKDAVRNPERSSKFVKGLLIRFNPVLMVAALRNDASMLNAQKIAVAVQQAIARQFPKGVKIQFNDELLGEMLRRATRPPSLSSLAVELERNQNSADADAKIAKYVEALTNAYRSSIPRHSPRQLVLLSLKRLVTEAEKYSNHWATLPENLLRPGAIGRIVGYRIDDEKGDVYLIGIPAAAPAAALSLDEIITGVTAAFINDESPFCSLDPDPSNVGGVQMVRVGGVPVNSQFARTMLDADYLMKKINAGLIRVDAAQYKSIDVILRERSDRYEHVNVMSRFWFYPTPLRPGDIELSSDSKVVFFAGGLQVLSEQMVKSRDGLVGTGRSDTIANELANGFTKALPDMATKFPDIARLHGLFDVVLLGRLWRQMEVRSEWIDRLASLPTTTLAEKTYEGVTAKVYAGTTSTLDLYLTGGVRLRTAAGGRAMFVIDHSAQKIVRSVSPSAASVATQIDFNDSLPAASSIAGRNIDAAVITAMIARGEFDRASIEIQRLLGVDPFDAEAWCLKAENDLQRSRFVSAIHNAERALELAPDDPENHVRASVDLFSAYFMLGETDSALDAIKRATEFVPDSFHARLFYADALAVSGRFEEARKEFRAIQRRFPYSPEPLIRFAVFEVSEGNVMSGKQLVDRATKLSSTDVDRSAADSALALAEAGMAILDSPESHLQTAQSLANKVLANKASSPVSRLRALNAKSITALAKENISEAEAIVEQVMRITPANPTILLTLAQWAHYNNRAELALRYLVRAEKIAPNMPLVKAVGLKIRGGQ